MADNHRRYANDQLNSESISFVDQSPISVQSQNSLEIPSAEMLSDAATSTVNNNFNVNINSSGSTTTNASGQRADAHTIINNVMNSTSKDNPLAIKKNSNSSSTENGSNSVTLLDAELPYEENGHQRYANEIETFSDYSQFLSPAPPLDSLGISSASFDLPSIANYEYSVAHIKEENNIIKHRIQSIKDIINKALNEVSVSQPAAAYQTKMMIQQNADNQMYFDNTNVIFESNEGENSYDQVEQLTKEHHRVMELRQTEAEKSMMEVEREKDRKESESITTSQEMRDIQILPKTDFTATVPSAKVDNIIPHINNMNTSGYKLMSEMNRPPVWRSVLG